MTTVITRVYAGPQTWPGRHGAFLFALRFCFLRLLFCLRWRHDGSRDARRGLMLYPVLPNTVGSGFHYRLGTCAGVVPWRAELEALPLT